MKTTRPIVVLAFALAISGCPGPERREGPGPRESNVDKPRDITTDPSFWTSNVSADKDTFVVTDSIVVQDTEANAVTELREKALRRAVELTLRDIFRDEEKFKENENELRRLFVNQFQKYIESHEIMQQSRFGDGRQLGAKIKVTVARGKLAKDLQGEGMFREDQGQMRIILTLRKHAQDAAEVNELAAGYLEDLAEGLSREMLERGFQTKLWKDVRLSVAERRDGGDRQLDEFLVKFVEESEWRKPSDERYELPMILLRAEGRLLVGYRVLELEKRGLMYHTTMRADAYDLFNGQSLGYKTESNRRAIGDSTLLETRQALVSETASKLMRTLADSLQDFLDQQRRLKKKAPLYTFTFQGYAEADLARLETLLAGIVAEDIESDNDGTTLVVKAKLLREPIPVRDELQRHLKNMGLASKPARRQGTTMTFMKE